MKNALRVFVPVLFFVLAFGASAPSAFASYSTFDNPNYHYTNITNAPDGTLYKVAGLSPDGTKIVAQKSWNDGARDRIEVVLMNANGTSETVVSSGNSGEGDIYGYMNPFWSDDGTAVGFQETHNSASNKIIRYDLATAARTYIYEPVTTDATNADFLGNSKTSIVFWAYGPIGGADLFTWDSATSTNITNTSDYKEYEPVSNSDGTKIVYWSGETTAEPVNTTHTLTYANGWTKDVGFTPIADSYYAYWVTPAATQIALTVMSNKDIKIYDGTGGFVADLSGAGYSGGSGQSNFFGSMPQGPNGEYIITSNAGRGATPGRDIIVAAPRSATVYVSATGSDSNLGTQVAPFATIQKAINAVATGGTINVAAGDYKENVQIFNKTGLTIQGAGDGTLIDGTGYGIEIDNSSNLTIKDLKIITSGPNLHGIYVDDAGFGGRGASPSNNLIIQNTTISATGGVGNEATGIYGGNVTSGAHTGWLITGNRITADGGGIGLEDVTNSTVSNNTSTITNGTNILWLTMGFDLSTLVVSGNIVNGSGGSQVSFLTDYPSATGKSITGVTVSGNTFDTWGSRGLRIGTGVSGVAVSQNKFMKAGEALKNENSSTINAESNYWGEANPTFATKIVTTGGVVDNDPWYIDSGMTTSSGNPSFTSTTDGQADLPAGVNDVVLTNDTVMNLLSSTNSITDGSGENPPKGIIVAGTFQPLSSFDSGELVDVDLTETLNIGGEDVLVGEAVQLSSGTPDEDIVLTNSELPNVSVSIPDGTTILAPSGWDGTIAPPTDIESDGTAPSGFSVGDTVIEVGSPDVVLLFDKAVKITLTGVTGTVGYKPAGPDSDWKTITTQCTSADVPGISFPGECYFHDGGNTVIWTYHFTSFGELDPISPPPSNGGGGGGYSYPYSVSINNGAANTTSTSVTLTLTPTSNANQMQISNTSDSSSTWIPFLSTYPWTLTSGSGNKTVYVRYGNNGSWVGNAQDNIALATTPATPAVPGVTPAVPATPAQGRGQVLGAAVYNFINDLHMNSSGADVTELQKLLITEGFDIPAITKGGVVYGYFGGQTRAAVIAYQKAHNITPAVGYFGPLTRGELNKGSVVSAVAKTNLTTDQADAIISIIESFGADASVIAKVRSSLGR